MILFKFIKITRNSTANSAWATRIERFISRTVRLGYLPEDYPTLHGLVHVVEDRLLAATIANPDHVLLPLFLPTHSRRPGLRRRAHHFFGSRPKRTRIRSIFLESCTDPYFLNIN